MSSEIFPSHTITWNYDGTSSWVLIKQTIQYGYSVDDFKDDIQWAFNRWQQVANIKFSEHSSLYWDSADHLQLSYRADIFLKWGAIDGAGDGTNDVIGKTTSSTYDVLHLENWPLTYFETRPCKDIVFDEGETWLPYGGEEHLLGYSDEWFRALALHEIGHALGLDHYDASASIMNTYFNFNFPTDLTASDIGRIRAIYGASITDTKDFNSDGTSDILWRNNATGVTGFYQMNSNGTLQGWHSIGGSSTAYSVAGVGDFNSDGTSDILWRNNANGDTGFYQMNSNGTLQGWHSIGGSSTAYLVAGTGDYNSDGTSDILFRNNATGDTGYYQMNSNGTLQGWHAIGGSSTAYNVVG